MAIEAKPAKTKTEPAAPAKPKDVIFESRNPEPLMFDVAGYSSCRDHTSTRLEWHVRADDVERFKAHFFYQTGRVVLKNVRDE